MNTKYILIAVLLLVVLVSVIIVIKRNKKVEIVPIEKNPKELELTYDINSGIPFKWEFEIEDPTVVEFVKSYVVKSDNTDTSTGGKVYTNYVFKGLKKGTTTITFKYIYFDDNKVHKKRSHIINVDEDNNISEDNS